MAFQMSRIATRVSLSKSVGLISKADNRFSGHLKYLSKCTHGLTERFFYTGGKQFANIKVLHSQRLVPKAKVWEKVCTTSKLPHSQGGRAVVIGALGVSATVIATLHTGKLYAMSARPDLNLDSDSGDWKDAKKKLSLMDKEARRKMYRIDFIPLENVPVWSSTGDSSCKPLYKANEELNMKISLFRGDITKLEIDAIANAANKTLLGGGGVDGAIHRGAGPLLRKECATLNGCETGEAKITGAYGLPASYVIHTVGPIVHGSVGEKDKEALRNCYYNCLQTATKNHLRTVAFPCISTGVYGYPPDQAVEVALKTVREYLEENHEKLDRVIFCVFLKSDKELYETRLPAYFSQGSPPKSKL